MAAHIIGENISADQARNRVAAINHATRDRVALVGGAAVREYHTGRRTTARPGVKTFPITPSAVSAATDNVDLFVNILAHVCQVKKSCDRIKTETPWIAQTHRIEFRPHA